MRNEPPPSEPSVIGTLPAATAAADPQLEPPAVRVGSQGLRVTRLHDALHRRRSLVGNRIGIEATTAARGHPSGQE